MFRVSRQGDGIGDADTIGLPGRTADRRQVSLTAFGATGSEKATGGTRTLNPRFTKAVLYRLSYGGVVSTRIRGQPAHDDIHPGDR